MHALVRSTRAILFLAGIMPASGQSLQTLFESGPRDQRLNLVVLSEGYTTAQLTSDFPRDAAGLVEAMMAREPYASFRNYFNAYAIAVASNESGADYPANGTVRDTYFNATFGTNGLERLLYLPGSGSSKVYSLLGSLLPQYDIPLVLVNDPRYGGSGGPIAVASVEESANEVVIHEIGHSLAGLGDEYDSAGSQSGETPNTTQVTDRALIRWRHWILPSTPIVTPELPTWGNVVGLFEGASYQTTGWYRPTLDSLMNNLNRDFKAVNEEAIMLSALERLSRITRGTPAAATLTSTDGQPLTFRVEALRPAAAAVSPVTWYVDNVPATGSLQEHTLIPRGAAWRYRSAATAPAGNWMAAAFDDASWASGPAPLGFGDNNEATIVPGGPSTSRYPAIYFRHTFNVTSPAAWNALRLELRRDDGAVVWLNGTEIYRSNMASGAVNFNTLAAFNDGDPSESWYYDAVLPVTSLMAGSNVLAVEVHQNSLTSSDLKFDLALKGRVAGYPLAEPQLSAWIPAGASWRYWDRGAPPADWASAAYDDNTWSQGAARLGYGNGGEATVIGYGGNTSNRYPTAYFRRAFDVAQPDPSQRVLLRLKFDDGAVVWLNGTPVARANLPWGTVQYATLAGKESPTDGQRFSLFEIDSAALVPGRNVLAVEIHQNSVTSSDLAFDLELRPLAPDIFTVLPAALGTGAHTIEARYLDPTGKILQDPAGYSEASRRWTVNVTLPTDSDADGLPDAWELTHFGNLAQGATDDPDGDGANNVEEIAAGTLPADPASRFAIVLAQHTPAGQVQLQWTSVPGRLYQVQSTASAASGPWATVSQSTAAAALTGATVDGPANSQPLYFRILVTAP